jgi:hypothetical protein
MFFERYGSHHFQFRSPVQYMRQPARLNFCWFLYTYDTQMRKLDSLGTRRVNKEGM